MGPVRRSGCSRKRGTGWNCLSMRPSCCNGLMQFNTYTYAGAHIAAWLVNHPAPEALALAQVLHDHDVHEPTATSGQVLMLRPWAQRLRGIFEAGTLSAKALGADELLVASDCRPRLVSHGPGLLFHLHYASVHAGLTPGSKPSPQPGWRMRWTTGRPPPAGLQPRRVQHRFHRHLAQRPPPFLQRPVCQPGQRSQPPPPPAAGTAALTLRSRSPRQIRAFAHLTDAYSYADPGPVECMPEPGWTVHGEPLAARVRPSSLSISRIRSRSVTGPVCEIKAPGKAPGRAHVTCCGGRSPGERCADGERVDLPQFPEPGRVVVRGDLRVHRHHH